MKLETILYSIIVLIFGACSFDSNGEHVSQMIEEVEPLTVPAINSDSIQIDSIMEAKGFIDIQKVNPAIQIDLKYASSDNFMGIVLYHTLKKVYLQKEVAQKLSKCQEFLDSLKPGYRFLVYDGVRPVEVQQNMWDALDSIPVSERGKFVSNPKNRSLHNYGAAIDLTILDSLGNVLDMGAGYDDMRKIAYPSLEQEFLASKALSQEAYRNRLLLRRVMRHGKFRNIPSEWWHFNSCSRAEAAVRYQLLLEEPKIH